MPRRLTAVTLQSLDWLIARIGRAEDRPDVLCFIEVKTRTTRDVKPAHAAVDREKQRELIAMAHEYLHHLGTKPPWRVDVISVYIEGPTHPADRSITMELFKNAFPVS